MRYLRYGLAALALAALGVVGFVYAAPERALALAFGMERDRAGLERHERTMPDGTQIAYLEGGSGEPLVLLHGFGAEKDHFTRVARFLTPHFRVIIPDLIGFAESTHAADLDYRAAAQAERLRAFAIALGVPRPHVGGSSMGGQVALAWAAAHPDEVQSLWLLAPAGIWTAPKSEVRTMFDRTGLNPLLVRREEDLHAMMPLVMEEPPFLPRPLLDVTARARIANGDLEERIFEQIFTDSLEARVTGLETPALIVWGDRDRTLHPGSAEILHRLMPKSEVLMMPGIGHVPMIERPRESAEAYLRFRGIP